MIIVRPDYLNRLIKYQDTEFIKVLTGVRRCGKSFVLSMFHEHLMVSGIASEQILYINFEHPDTESLKTETALNDYLKKSASPNLTDIENCIMKRGCLMFSHNEVAC